MKTFLLFVTLLFCVHRIPAYEKDETILKEQCRSYMDKLIPDTFKHQKDRLDPRKLVEKKLSFNVLFMMYTYVSEVKLHDGKLEGLSKGKRYGDVTVAEKNNKAICEAMVDFRDLWITYKATVTYRTSLLGMRTVSVSVIGKPLESRVVIQAASPIEGGNVEIGVVKIDRISRIRMDIEGFGSLYNFMVSPFTDAMSKVFRPMLKGLASVDLKAALQDEATKLDNAL